MRHVRHDRYTAKDPATMAKVDYLADVFAKMFDLDAEMSAATGGPPFAPDYFMAGTQLTARPTASPDDEPEEDDEPDEQ